MIQIFLLFLLSLSVRLIKIQDYLFFGFEQGRDLQIVQKIYQFEDFVLVGPSTSIGGVFHGPWYYYLLAIPLGINSGNPLAASIFLIILGALLPIVVYLFAHEIFNSKAWGMVAGLITVFSYEYILYARWLSNVSPSPLFIALAFFMLWKYIRTEKGKYFLLFTFFALTAVLFQMILIAQFLAVLILLAAFKQLKLPSIKTLILSLFIATALFSPMIIFDLRNQNIISSSLINFALNSDSKESGSFLSSITAYLTQMRSHLQTSLVNIQFLPIQFIVLLSIIFATFTSFKSNKKQIIFLLSWILMSLPVIFISPGNPQYYVGIGLAWILLFVLTLKTFWENKRLKIISILLAILFLGGVFFTINNLLQNKDVFFRTIQDDLNYADQKRVLEFIHNDSNNDPYRLVSFTIPSLKSEAWDYLKQYFYPNDPQENAKIIYIVIEKNVYKVWEDKWINDLGPTNLQFEKKFGILRVQKRLTVEQKE